MLGFVIDRANIGEDRVNIHWQLLPRLQNDAAAPDKVSQQGSEERCGKAERLIRIHPVDVHQARMQRAERNRTCPVPVRGAVRVTQLRRYVESLTVAADTDQTSVRDDLFHGGSREA